MRCTVRTTLPECLKCKTSHWWIFFFNYFVLFSVVSLAAHSVQLSVVPLTLCDPLMVIMTLSSPLWGSSLQICWQRKATEGLISLPLPLAPLNTYQLSTLNTDQACWQRPLRKAGMGMSFLNDMVALSDRGRDTRVLVAYIIFFFHVFKQNFTCKLCCCCSCL